MEWLYRYAFWAKTTDRRFGFLSGLAGVVTASVLVLVPHGWIGFLVLMVAGVLVPIGSWLDRRAHDERAVDRPEPAPEPWLVRFSREAREWGNGLRGLWGFLFVVAVIIVANHLGTGFQNAVLAVLLVIVVLALAGWMLDRRRRVVVMAKEHEGFDSESDQTHD